MSQSRNISRDGPAASTVSALALDLYELTMAQSYVDEGMDASATFSLFVRNLPPERGYLVCAGLEDVPAGLHGDHGRVSDQEAHGLALRSPAPCVAAA